MIFPKEARGVACSCSTVFAAPAVVLVEMSIGLYIKAPKINQILKISTMKTHSDLQQGSLEVVSAKYLFLEAVILD